MVTKFRLIPALLAISLAVPATSAAKIQTQPSASPTPYPVPAGVPNPTQTDSSSSGSDASATPSTDASETSNPTNIPETPASPQSASPSHSSAAKDKSMPLEPPETLPSSAPPENHDVELEVPEQPVKVHSPQFGMNLDKVKRGENTYGRRQWADMLRNDPELLRLHRIGRLVWPGGIITALGGAWLMLSIASDIDWGGNDSSSATGTLVGYVFPLALIGGGIPMVVLGARARIKLHHRHVELMATPISFNSGVGQGGGAMIVGRF